MKSLLSALPPLKYEEVNYSFGNVSDIVVSRTEMTYFQEWLNAFTEILWRLWVCFVPFIDDSIPEQY
jgi:hypothetical protein